MTERPTLADIERLAEAYAYANQRLGLLNDVLGAEVSEVFRRRMPEIRGQIALTIERRDALRRAVAAAPELFGKPRTRVLSGVKVGFQRLKSALAIKDEAPIIARIKALMPARVSELIRTQEFLRRQALESLAAVKLKQLGIGLVLGSDVVVAKPQPGDALKTTEALLQSHGLTEDGDPR